MLTHLNTIASSNNWKLYYRLQPTYKAVCQNWKKWQYFYKILINAGPSTRSERVTQGFLYFRLEKLQDWDIRTLLGNLFQRLAILIVTRFFLQLIWTSLALIYIHCLIYFLLWLCSVKSRAQSFCWPSWRHVENVHVENTWAFCLFTDNNNPYFTNNYYDWILKTMERI